LVLDVLEASRAAVLEFLTAAPSWNERELRGWLAGAYRRALGDEETNVNNVELEARALGRADVLHAHQRLVEFIEDCRFLLAAERIVGLVDDGWVRPVSDARGGSGFVAIDRPGASLSNRLIALVAADYLTRPRDYMDHLVSCPECEIFLFDWDAKAHVCRKALVGA
jgi:hypothetical protein